MIRASAMVSVALMALALFTPATPATAFDTDYSKVFARIDADTPDAIARTGATTRRADLPGNVHIVETTLSDGTTTYFGYDDSPEGAPGCTFNIMVEVLATLFACPQMLDAAGRAALTANLDASARFVGANAIPPVPQDDIPARLMQLVETRSAAMARTGLTCPTPDDPELMPIIRTTSNPDFRHLLNRMHAVPRLPVSNPCL